MRSKNARALTPRMKDVHHFFADVTIRRGDENHVTSSEINGMKPVKGADSPTMNSSILNGASARLSETDHTPVQPRKLDLRLRKASRQGSALSSVVQME